MDGGIVALLAAHSEASFKFFYNNYICYLSYISQPLLVKLYFSLSMQTTYKSFIRVVLSYHALDNLK